MRTSNRALVCTSDQSLTFSTRREKLESVFEGLGFVDMEKIHVDSAMILQCLSEWF